LLRKVHRRALLFRREWRRARKGRATLSSLRRYATIASKLIDERNALGELISIDKKIVDESSPGEATNSSLEVRSRQKLRRLGLNDVTQALKQMILP
jgi:hypothetical protein